MHVTKMHLAFLDSIGKKQANATLRARVVDIIQVHAGIQVVQQQTREREERERQIAKEKALARLATCALEVEQAAVRSFAFGGTEAFDM